MFDYREAVAQEVANRSGVTREMIARAVAVRVPHGDYLAVIESLLLYPIADCVEGRWGSPSGPIPSRPSAPEPTPPAFSPSPVRSSGMGSWPRRPLAPLPVEPDEDELPPLPRKPVERPKNGPVTVRHQPPAPAAPSRWSGPSGHGQTYRAFLDSVVKVGDGMKRRRDCTRADLRVIIDGHLSDAGREERLHKIMERAKAKTVGDLPETALADILRETTSCQ